MSVEREMSLAEYVGRLPKIHLATKEFTALQESIAEMELSLQERWENLNVQDNVIDALRAENKWLREIITEADEKVIPKLEARIAEQSALITSQGIEFMENLDRIAELKAERTTLRKALEHVRFYALDNVPEELREVAKIALAWQPLPAPYTAPGEGL